MAPAPDPDAPNGVSAELIAEITENVKKELLEFLKQKVSIHEQELKEFGELRDIDTTTISEDSDTVEQVRSRASTNDIPGISSGDAMQDIESNSSPNDPWAAIIADTNTVANAASGPSIKAGAKYNHGQYQYGVPNYQQSRNKSNAPSPISASNGDSTSGLNSSYAKNQMPYSANQSQHVNDISALSSFISTRSRFTEANGQQNWLNGDNPLRTSNEILDRSNRPPQDWRSLIPTSNTRKVLRILINSQEHTACPDSGSEQNIMSEKFAIENGFKISRTIRDTKPFELGSGKKVFSIGRVKATVELLGKTLRKRARWFYVFAICLVSLILGMSFLAEAEILTKNRYMLESCPLEFSGIPTLLWIGSPRKRDKGPCNRMECTLDGHRVMAVADTGSDLNFMCPKCAEREGFHVDSRDEARISVQIGDGSMLETIGQVLVHDLSLDWREPVTKTPQQARKTTNSEESPSKTSENSFGTIFHVLPGMSCDVILGRDLLDETDAFNRCAQTSCTRVTSKGNPYELNIMIFKRKRKRTGTAPDPKEVHDDERHAEMLRRSRREDELLLLSGDDKTRAEELERVLCRHWDARHLSCGYCTP